MRISDWSSDVCSSDLDAEHLANLAGPFDAHLRLLELRLGVEIGNRGNVFRIVGPLPAVSVAERVLRELWRDTAAEILTEPAQIGRGSCRERVCQYVLISVVAVAFKKTEKTKQQ